MANKTNKKQKNLFKKLTECHVPEIFVKLLANWYSSQLLCIRWGTTYSKVFYCLKWSETR